MFILELSFDSTQASQQSNIIGNTTFEKPEQEENNKSNLPEQGPDSYSSSNPYMTTGVRGANTPTLNGFDLRHIYLNPNEERRLFSNMNRFGFRFSEYFDRVANQAGVYSCREVGEERGSRFVLQALQLLIKKIKEDEERQKLTNEMIQEHYLQRMLADRETRELLLVFTTLMFAVANPIGGLQSLGRLVNSLHSAQAKQAAANGMPGIADLAKKLCESLAKEHPELAKQLSLILGNIAITCSGSTCGVEHFDFSGHFDGELQAGAGHEHFSSGGNFNIEHDHAGAHMVNNDSNEVVNVDKQSCEDETGEIGDDWSPEGHDHNSDTIYEDYNYNHDFYDEYYDDGCCVEEYPIFCEGLQEEVNVAEDIGNDAEHNVGLIQEDYIEEQRLENIRQTNNENLTVLANTAHMRAENLRHEINNLDPENLNRRADLTEDEQEARRAENGYRLNIQA